MAIDKDKTAKNALKYIQKGQFQKAIEEYQKVLSSDPRDIRARLKLVDLYGRTGKKKEAIEECLQVAESYADQGFNLKAIAVYRQALRADPSSPRLYRSVGELYVKQGLMGDAMASFKKGVDVLRELGRTAEAGEVLARMEEMAPDNAAIKVHLAELYLAEGKIQAFEEELQKIVLQLKGEGRTRKLLQAVESFYEKSNRNPTVLKRLAELYSDLHEEEKALEVVRYGLANNPSDRDLRLLALRAYLTLGNLAEARRVALGLYDEDPEDLFILEQLAAIAQARGDQQELGHAFKTLAKAYGRRGLPQKEEHYYRKALEVLPKDAEARIALGDVELAVPQDEPEVVEEGSFWSGGEAQPAGGADALEAGLLEADLYLKYGMDQKASEKLKELTAATPNNLEVRKKLRDLCQRKGDRAGWVCEQLQVAELLLRQSKENEALRAYQAILEVAPDNADARKAIQYLKPDVLPTRPSAIEIDVDGATVEFVDVAGEEKAVYRRTELGAEDEKLKDGLAEADFYEAQGLMDEATASLLRLRQAYPDSPHVFSRLERLGWEGEGGGQEYVDLQAEVLDAAAPDLGPEMVGFQDFEVTELDDIVKEFRSSVAERLEEGDYETHYNLGVAYKEMGLLEDAMQEFQIAARSIEKSREAYTSMSLVFRETGRQEDARAALRMALAVASNTPEDRAAILYELGCVAQEQQDWDGALQAFQKVAAIDPGFRDLPRLLQTAKARCSE